MKVSVHITCSVIAAGLLGLISGSWAAAAWSCVSGILVDLDHVPDYLAARPDRVSASGLFDFWRGFQEPRIYLVLHAWELVPALAFAWILGWAPAVTGGLAFGLLQHLSLDQFGNRVHAGGYWLTRRLATGFRTEYVLRDYPPS